MKRIQKWISLLVTGAMLVSLFPAALAADEAGGAGPETMSVSIYHLSDGVEIHGVTYDSVYSASEIDGDWAQARTAGVEGYEYSGYDVIDYDDYAEVNLDYTLIPQAPDPVQALLELIAALPDAADVTLDDADNISAAVAAYGMLSYTEQQELKTTYRDAYTRLGNASDALDALLTDAAWSDVPTALEDGAVLDLSGRAAVSNDAGGKTIQVAGNVTVIGIGTDTNCAINGLSFVLTDGAILTMQDLYVKNPSSYKTLPCVTLEAGASATLIASGEGGALTSYSSNPAVTIPADSALTLDGGALLTVTGPIKGEGTLAVNGGELKMSPKAITCGAVAFNGGTVSASNSDVTADTITVSGGAVAIQSFNGNMTVNSGSLSTTEWGYSAGSLTVNGGSVTAGKAKSLDVTVTGGEAVFESTVTGNIEATGGALTLNGSSSNPALVGSLTVADGASAALKAGFNGQGGVSAIEGNLTVADGASFSAVASSDKIVDGTVDGNVLLVSFAQTSKSEDTALRVNGDPALSVTLPPYYNGFALAVPQAEEYTATDRFGAYMVTDSAEAAEPARLTIGGVNTGMVWKPTGAELPCYIDMGRVAVSATETGYTYTIGGATHSVDGDVLDVYQSEPEATSNQIVVEGGVQGLTIVFHGLNMARNLAWEPLVTLESGADVTILLEGENTLTASGSCITLENGASLILDGGSLNATTTGSLAGAIQVLPGAALTIAGGTINAAVKSDAAGAAIGGRGATGGGADNWADCGTILITGDAVVNAQGGNDGAAIGGGQYGSGGDITITGSAKVTAIAGAHAAAIGGGGQSSDMGYDLAAGRITISGGADVYAVGGAGAAAIGRGRFAAAELSGGDITVTTGGSVTAFADGAYFAIDVPEAGDSGDTSILNARFADGELSYLPQAGNPIVVYAVDGDAARSLTLEHIGSNNPIRAFACTVPAGAYMVRNGAQGRELQHTEYTLLDGDRDFLFAVAGDAMTTRDDLRFKTFTITATAGRGGSISPAGATTVAPLGGQSYTITPDDHYLVDAVTVNGDTLEASGSYAFTGVTADQEIHASFKPVAQYVVRVNYYLLSEDADHVYTDADKVLDSFLAATGYAGDTYAVDAAVTSGQAVEGHTFAQLSGDPATGVLDGDKAINVYFTKNPAAQYSVRVNYYLLSADADHIYTETDKVLDSVTALTGLAGDAYAVDAALTSGRAVEGHTFAQLSGDPATGVLDGDKVINVYFTKNAGPEPENPGGGDDDERPVRPDRPDPIPDEEITDSETPLNPGPEACGEEQDIPDGETPLSPAPEGGEEVVVEEGEVPLGNLPQTGAAASPVNPALTLGLAALAFSLAAAGLSLRKRETEE